MFTFIAGFDKLMLLFHLIFLFAITILKEREVPKIANVSAVAYAYDADLKKSNI